MAARACSSEPTGHRPADPVGRRGLLAVRRGCGLGVYARAFGAVSNGKYDDTKPVQAAIDSLANGGGIVRLTGRFLLGALRFPAGQAIISPSTATLSWLPGRPWTCRPAST